MGVRYWVLRGRGFGWVFRWWAARGRGWGRSRVVRECGIRGCFRERIWCTRWSRVGGKSSWWWRLRRGSRVGSGGSGGVVPRGGWPGGVVGGGGEWRVDSPGLVRVVDDSGRVVFSDGSGRVVLVVPRAVVLDSAGTLGDRADAQGEVGVWVAGEGTGWVLSFAVDRGWMNDPARVYPVRVDPEVVPEMDSQRSFKTNGQANANYGIQVGNTNTNGVWRTLAHFDYERVFGKQVTGVGIFFGGMSRDSTVTNRWGTVSWGSRFGYDCVTESLGGVAWRGDGTGEVIDDRLTTKIAGWVRDGVRGAFLAFTGDEGRGFTYKHYRQSVMAIVYQDFPVPGRIASPAPVDGAVGVS